VVVATADGTLVDPTGTHAKKQQFWDPNGVRPLMERYLGTPFPELERSLMRGAGI